MTRAPENPPKMKAQRGTIASVLYALIGNRKTGLEVDGEGLTVLGSDPRRIPFAAISKSPRSRKGLLFGRIDVPREDGSVLRIRGLDAVEAKAFGQELSEAWRRNTLRHAQKVKSLCLVADQLESPRIFPAACLMEPFRRQVETLFRSVPKSFPDFALEPEMKTSFARLVDFHRSPARLRQEAMDRFLASELRDMAPFFESVEKNSLTQEQRRAVVCDEDATLVLAGAGSGKTSVITAKAAYLIEQGMRKPEEILLMTFAKDAADEMAQRVTRRCGGSVTAKTFHSLAYGILAEVEGTAPPLAHHAQDPKALDAHLRGILLECAGKDEKLKNLLLRWFSEFFAPAKSKFDFQTKHDYYRYIEANELRTLQGEKVRSFEELEIANWLYMQGVDYEYEPVYKREIRDTRRKTYTPDFRLKDSGVYIEHFGVRRERGRAGGERLTTAPFVDREEYLKGMKWKRRTHAKHGTILIETFSYEKSEGRLISGLRAKIAPYAKFEPRSPESVFERLEKMGQIDAFTKTLAAFLRHFKDAGLSLRDCRLKASEPARSPRDLAFLEIFEAVFSEYQRQLGRHIDFEDMITKATEHIRAGRYESPYRHLLVDEFQDISRGRAGLLMELKKRHSDARVFAVGDDWQSIYRFSGSDVRLMNEFGTIFGGPFAGESGVHRSVDLGKTFRSVERIARPARSFVLRNPSQIEKEMDATRASDNHPAIRIIWKSRNDGGETLKRILERLAERASGERSEVLLLGRYNRSRPDRLAELGRAYPDLSLSFKTIHSAKGLEADHVIILGADGGRVGLPSQITDDPVLELALPEPERFEHAEERRVFYVALTRARDSVAILASREKPSRFVTELLEHEEYGVTEEGESRNRQYRCPRCDGQLIQDSKSRRFICEHKQLCGASFPACAACGVDLPLRDPSRPGVTRCACGAEAPACVECSDGWMVERHGKYGSFFGCVNYPECAATLSLAKYERWAESQPQD